MSGVQVGKGTRRGNPTNSRLLCPRSKFGKRLNGTNYASQSQSNRLHLPSHFLSSEHPGQTFSAEDPDWCLIACFHGKWRSISYKSYSDQFELFITVSSDENGLNLLYWVGFLSILLHSSLSSGKMREGLGFLIWVCFFTCVTYLGSCRFVVKNSLRVTYPESLKDVYECATGDFGIPQNEHGGPVVGTVVYPQANQKSCSRSHHFDVSFKSQPADLPIFLLADRGSQFLIIFLFFPRILSFFFFAWKWFGFFFFNFVLHIINIPYLRKITWH